MIKDHNAIYLIFIVLTMVGICAAMPAYTQTLSEKQKSINEEMARWQQARDCVIHQSHSGTVKETTERLPSGWKPLTADGLRVQIMSDSGDDLILELRCIVRIKEDGNLAYVSVNTRAGDHVLRFWCDGTNRSEGRVYFDDVTSLETLNDGGRSVSPNTLVGSIGFFVCRNR
jgi:hypothetical protein